MEGQRDYLTAAAVVGVETEVVVAVVVVVVDLALAVVAAAEAEPAVVGEHRDMVEPRTAEDQADPGVHKDHRHQLGVAAESEDTAVAEDNQHLDLAYLNKEEHQSELEGTAYIRLELSGVVPKSTVQEMTHSPAPLGDHALRTNQQ